ncbi:hypothetical protein XI02_23520 [Bradyrhizobium sp. CCBAU 21365]|nr:hypothetical protein XI02_23520 [Bradyrhizobium sp. CCBAU 21365]
MKEPIAPRRSGSCTSDRVLTAFRGLEFRSRFVHIGALRESAAMDAERDREIIRLWNELRRLQRDGRPTAVLVRRIEKALAAREQEAA